MVNDGVGRSIEVVTWVDGGDSVICALMEIDGRVYAGANSRWGDLAVEHIRRHVAQGFDGVLLCSVDCKA